MPDFGWSPARLQNALRSSCGALSAAPRGPNRSPSPPTILHDQLGQNTGSRPAHSPRSSSGARCAALILRTRQLTCRAGARLRNGRVPAGACLRATCRARVGCARNESEIQRERGVCARACGGGRASGPPACLRQEVLVADGDRMCAGRGAHRMTDDVSCTRSHRTCVRMLQMRAQELGKDSCARAP